MKNMNNYEMTEKSALTSKAIDALGFLAVVLVFILPLKFGMMTGIPEVATTMPSSIMELFYFSWPYFIFSTFSALLLTGIALCAILMKQGFQLNFGISIVESWILLFLASLIGFFRASTLDFPLIQITLFLGVTSFALTIHQLLILRPNLRIWFINAIVASTLLIVLFGLNQYFSGFEETLNYVYAKEMKSGVKITGNMLSRLRETRVFATFSICNSLGAHLILTIPVCIWAMLSKSSSLKTAVVTLGLFLLYLSPSLHLSRVGFFLLAFATLTIVSLTLSRFPEKKRRLLSLIILIPVAGIMLFVFRHTNSRGAFLAAGVAILALAVMSPLSKKSKLIGCGIALLFMIPFLFTDILDRSLKSMYFRFDYYFAAIKMFLSHPLTGVGWGDFFHEYMRIKNVPGSEAPHTPHNFVLSFSSQTGIAGLAASLWVMSAPLILCWKRRKVIGINWFNAVVLASWIAWCIHSLIDFNIQVPGTLGIAVVLLLLLNTTCDSREPLIATAKNNENILNTNEIRDTLNQNDTEQKSKHASTSWKYLTIAIILALITSFISFERWRAEAKFNQLMLACGMGVAGNPEIKMLSDAQLDTLLSNCVKVAPYSPFPWICAGNFAQSKRKW